MLLTDGTSSKQFHHRAMPMDPGSASPPIRNLTSRYNKCNWRRKMRPSSETGTSRTGVCRSPSGGANSFSSVVIARCWTVSLLIVFGVLFGTLDGSHATSNAASSWIIGVQCQVKCLEDFREAIAKVDVNNEPHFTTPASPTTTAATSASSNPNQLFHECAEDADCSSCLQPCWNETLEYERCTKICQSTRSKEPCLVSCQYMANTSRISGSSFSRMMTAAAAGHKTECEQATGGSTTESAMGRLNQTSCIADGDHIQCPTIAHLSVTEVWETRGASLHWKTAVRHNHQHLPEIYPYHHSSHRRAVLVLYVVQMQQLVRKHPLVTTDWAVVTTPTLATTCNVTNALTMGLHYRARIVAVSSQGICSISAESRAFGLPKGHPIPGAPHNLRYDSYNRDEGGVLGYTVFWDPPNYALVISYYVITFARITDNASASGNSNPPTVLPKLMDNNHSQRTAMLHRQPHAKVSGNKHSYKIKNLMLNSTYVITIQAVAQFGDQLLVGHPAALKIQTLRLLPTRRVTTLRMSTTTTTEPKLCDRLLTTSITNVRVQTPFYVNGTLKANLTWNYQKEIRNDIDHFVIRLWSQHCPVIFDHSMKRHESQRTAKPQNSSILIDGLRFDCSYQVAISAVSNHCRHGPETLMTFETQACHNVTVREGSLRPNCPRFAPQQVKCDVSTLSKPVKVACEWIYRLENASAIRGFLIVAKTHIAHQNFGFNNATTNLFVSKDVRHAVLTDLIPKSKYHFMVRAVGDNGSGPDGHASFFVPPVRQGPFQQAAHQTWQQNGGPSSSLRSSPAVGLLWALLFSMFLAFVDNL